MATLLGAIHDDFAAAGQASLRTLVSGGLHTSEVADTSNRPYAAIIGADSNNEMEFSAGKMLELPLTFKIVSATADGAMTCMVAVRDWIKDVSLTLTATEKVRRVKIMGESSAPESEIAPGRGLDYIARFTAIFWLWRA